MLTRIIKVFTPPYKIHDLPAVLGILLLFLIIPVVTLNLNKTGDLASRAAVACAANLSYEVIGIGTSNTLKVDAGQSVSIKAKGFSGCPNTDLLKVRLWGFANAPWQGWKNQAQCQLGLAATDCLMTFTAPNSPDVGYPIQVIYDAGNNGSVDAQTGWPNWLYVNKISTALCSGKPVVSVSKISNVQVNETIEATISGISGCKSPDTVILRSQNASSNTIKSHGGCIPLTGQTSCKISFQLDTSGTHLVWGVLDIKGDGISDSTGSEVLVQVVQSCSGKPTTSLNKTNVKTGEITRATGTGLSGCSSNDTLILQYWNWTSNVWAQKATCRLSNITSCYVDFSFSTPNSYPLQFVLDTNSDGSINAYGTGWATLYVDEGCTGNPSISLSNTNVKTNENVRATGSGLAKCSSSDKLTLEVWSWSTSNWSDVNSCTLANSSSCYVDFSFGTENSYPVRFKLDIGGNGSIEKYSDWIFLYVTKPIENSLSCNGKYTTNGSGGSYYTPNLNTTGNFGDPSCDYSYNELYNVLWSLDSAHAFYFWSTIVPCESGNNPNATFFGSPDPAGAWGLFQMGRGKNGQYDHGDVIWRQQASNAINYHIGLGHGYGYWQCR